MISVKSKSELDLMRRAGEVVALAHKKVEEAIMPGVTTAELDRIAEEVIRKHGAIPSFKGYKCPYPDGIDYPSSICASINNEVVHGIPGLRELKDGDIISIDIGAYLNGFHGDAARTFAVGKISPEAQRLIEATKQSFFEGIKNAVEGNRIIDISSAIESYVVSFGYSVVRDYVGHGIGREMHEEPPIPNYRSRERGPRLQRGMTLAVEPMVNEGTYKVKLLPNKWTVVTADGKLSAHYENTIAITENEPIILTMLD
ncbi:type I methionyl aminopeptidase [Acetivibrio clariflavus]|uniref:Methionine aminopeptidase n=1 Tax=Acetivibrio clariflavus (strain DSM 19732 / NBRC 101661 / EBR45) TaxID=720554 RepID=G8M2F1_ACECE|nr:type I methionyl aminopeptidase [Acetivibrio clariflavus]AEV70321.1 methionine aminopeptidase, type I [Acetivibrio clariflavus DSM 19732]HOQ01333.1 type I methionyl aminopeptidase [Acetivibrio clariflavus]HPU40864.1 type I methionyl aminopeptidase [Acetivibrio clariflavus]